MPESLPPQPSFTFEDAAAKAKGLTDAFVLNALNDTLEVVPGNKELFLKSYFDMVPADGSDEIFVDNPDVVTQYRNDLSDFVSRRLGFFVADGTLNTQEKQELARRMHDFRLQLEADKAVVANFAHTWMGGTPMKYPRAAMDFYGMRLKDKHGNEVDLIHERIPGITPSVTVQDSPMANFIHWKSKGYLTARANHQAPVLTKRIYMNPTAVSSVRIFDQVATAAEEAGLPVRGKIYDRSADAFNGRHEREEGKPFRLRGDGIVLYASDADADKLLGIVEDIYTKFPGAFRGRKISRVPLRIGDGVAVGEEPGVEGTSLTSHRASVMADVIQMTRDKLGIEWGKSVAPADRSRALRTFHALWKTAAEQAGIDTHNIAFNKR